MKRWCDLMSRHVAGPIIKYNDTFFDWMEPQILMIDDYAYVGMDFHNDPDLVLPEVSQWGDLGKKNILLLWCFCNFLQNIKHFFLCVFNPMTNQNILTMQM
jgi:hypothetical protein